MATRATLKDGYGVDPLTLQITRSNLHFLLDASLSALIDLVEKCKNPGHNFVRGPDGDSSIILRERCLIDNTGTVVSEEVRRIVMNSIEGSGQSLKLVSPIKGNQLS
jgi:hypothetical protein